MHIIFHSILFFIWTNIFEIYFHTQIILIESKNIYYINQHFKINCFVITCKGLV